MYWSAAIFGGGGEQCLLFWQHFAVLQTNLCLENGSINSVVAAVDLGGILTLSSPFKINDLL